MFLIEYETKTYNEDQVNKINEDMKVVDEVKVVLEDKMRHKFNNSIIDNIDLEYSMESSS